MRHRRSIEEGRRKIRRGNSTGSLSSLTLLTAEEQFGILQRRSEYGYLTHLFEACVGVMEVVLFG